MRGSPSTKSETIRVAEFRGLACLLALLCAALPVSAAPYSWHDVPRIVAISDPHGAYDAMVRTLENAGIIDSDRNWSGKDSHLVVTGDMMDRGADSRKVMDLVMQLEQQALADGGMVHLLLGNHEVMNLVGDLRYVAPGEYAAFAEDESGTEREHWLRLFGAQRLGAGETDEAALRAEFDQDRPPGFFGHRQAFGSDGIYGRWLMSKPLMVVVNGTAFVHGGLPPLVADLGLAALNDNLRSQVSDYVQQVGVLNEAGLMDPALNFYRHAEHVQSLAAMTTLTDEIRVALQTITDLNNSSVHSNVGPLWYRGTVGCSTLIESDRLAEALRAVGAERVVIGHTPTKTGTVLQRHGGRVIEIDTGMLNSVYSGSGHALIIEKDELWVASEHTPDLQRVAQHPRRVGFRPGNLTANNLEYFLTHGEIVSSGSDEAGRRIVELSDGEARILAVFTADVNRRGLNRELAAYKLDRLLDLDMVPVTVAREIDGDRGSLQFLPNNVRNEQERVASGSGGSAWCPIADQWGAMYIFDALIYNPGRPATKMLYNLENWQLILVGNDDTFGTSKGRPPYLAQVELKLSAAWKSKLSALDEASLGGALEGILDRRRIAALASRRDRLLQSNAGDSPPD